MESLEMHLQNIEYAYKDKKVLDGVSYAFLPGAITVVLGRSGSGKSTLLQIINGLIKPQTGNVFIGGDWVNNENVRSLRLKTGFVIQHTGLFPHMNIAKNISLPGKITGMAKEKMNARVNELMNISLLPLSYKTKYPYELSGGEQQRAGLCRALFLEPPVLLMDEPFASLDYVTKQSLYAYVEELQKRNPRTIILITHDFDEAVRLADEFVWIESGVIRDTGN
ncbi:MAG TPA: ATP-binding cassette domain-containing protein, partial [Flavobacteriales bacterium]|nr:ATP-binding cassette domain-containing protein [Flavobacteriales bacterium]